MDFILNEAIEEEDNYKLVFSDDSEEDYSKEEDSFVENNEDKMFVCYSSSDEDGEQGASFYRSVNNKEEHVKFPNQTRNPEEVVNESEDEYFGKEDMPELFDPEIREEVKFDYFNDSFDKSQLFKNSLLCFTNVDNRFFMQLFVALWTVKLTDRMRFNLKMLKKHWEGNFL